MGEIEEIIVDIIEAITTNQKAIITVQDAVIELYGLFELHFKLIMTLFGIIGAMIVSLVKLYLDHSNLKREVQELQKERNNQEFTNKKVNQLYKKFITTEKEEGK